MKSVGGLGVEPPCEHERVVNQYLHTYSPLKIQPTPHRGEGSGNVQVEDCLLELRHQ